MSSEDIAILEDNPVQERPLTTEEIWQKLNNQDKIVASAIALSGISITVPYLEKLVGNYFKDQPESEQHQLVEKILVKLIASGVVEWTTPVKKAAELAENLKSKNPQKLLTYSDEAEHMTAQTAKQVLEKLKQHPEEGKQIYVSVAKKYQPLAVLNPANRS